MPPMERIFVRLYYKDTCPHSMKMLPEWAEFQQRHDGTEVDNTKITVLSVCLFNGRDTSHAGWPRPLDLHSVPSIWFMKDRVEVYALDNSSGIIIEEAKECLQWTIGMNVDNLEN